MATRLAFPMLRIGATVSYWNHNKVRWRNAVSSILSSKTYKKTFITISRLFKDQNVSSRTFRSPNLPHTKRTNRAIKVVGWAWRWVRQWVDTQLWWGKCVSRRYAMTQFIKAITSTHAVGSMGITQANTKEVQHMQHMQQMQHTQHATLYVRS